MTTTGEVSFTKKEVEKLLAACTNLEDEVMLRLAVTTGLRRVDLSRVTIQNIREGSLTFHEHKKDRRKEGKVIEERWRTIPLSPVVIQKIEQLKEALGKEGQKKNEGYLFSWGKSEWGDKTAFNRLQALCSRAGIPERPFHALRSSAVKLMQASGYTPEEVAKITGDTIAVIQQHYATPTDAELMERVKAKELI